MRDDIGVVFFLRPVERAELAIDIADVRVVDVAVDDVGDDFVAATFVGAGLGQLPTAIGQRAEFLQRQMSKAAALRPGSMRWPSQTFCSNSSSDAS